MFLYLRRLSRFESPSRSDWLLYFTAFIVLQVPAIINFYYNNGTENAYTQFAQSILNGQLELPPMNDYGDMAFVNGKYYLPYPPLPAFILVPFVAVLGAEQVNTVAIATIMACISLYTLYKILIKLQVKQEYFGWLFLAFFFGTGYWLAVYNSHHSYSFAHITSCMFQFLLLNEILGKKRWLLVGLYIGLSFLTRQFTIFYFLLALGYLFYTYKNKGTRVPLIVFLSLVIPSSICVGLYLLYNYIRFGSVFDTGYNYIIYLGILNDRVSEYGVFNAKYFLYNFYCFFLKGFNIEFEGKTHLAIKDMDLWGTSLLAASPFLLASLKARLPKILNIAAWLTVCLILFGQFFYHNNGWHQINTSRFSLDFLPLLMILTSMGYKQLPSWLFKGMIVYAVLLNAISYLIHSIYQ
ncbi:MAG TPA: hypothetical protein VFQ73_02670 [Flavisolibacter sp.]|nr:hypothetical protein [Flavisolibacter sp.]